MMVVCTAISELELLRTSILSLDNIWDSVLGAVLGSVLLARLVVRVDEGFLAVAGAGASALRAASESRATVSPKAAFFALRAAKMSLGIVGCAAGTKTGTATKKLAGKLLPFLGAGE